jgi:hypothetical protein
LSRVFAKILFYFFPEKGLTFVLLYCIIIDSERQEVIIMASRNDKKKLTHEDKFARHFYCQRARLNSIRRDKKANTKKMRKINKEICKKSVDNQ